MPGERFWGRGVTGVTGGERGKVWDAVQNWMECGKSAAPSDPLTLGASRSVVSDGFVTTPSVVAATQAQFGCEGATGAPLEDDGGEGTSGSHWEAAAFQGELMMGATAGALRAVLSEATLALADDSGWYESNRAAAGFLRHGHLSGCELIQV